MDFKESKPIYLQIADRIMDEILQGEYPSDSRIPSVREYAAKVEVNANTVARSFDYLQGKEIIYNKRGIGYFVSTEAKAIISDMHKTDFVENYLPEMFRKMDILGIDIEEIVNLYKNK